MYDIIQVVRKDTGEVVEKFDVTHEAESSRNQLRTGLRANLNHAEYKVETLEGVILVHLVIDNFYEDGDEIQTRVETYVPAPPPQSYEDAYEEWSQDYIFEQTGTGKTEGNSGYFVKCVYSSDTSLVDREWEFV